MEGLGEDVAKITFQTLDEAAMLLDQLAAPEPEGTMVRGYKGRIQAQDRVSRGGGSEAGADRSDSGAVTARRMMAARGRRR